jgi:hypothetical protein
MYLFKLLEDIFKLLDWKELGINVNGEPLTHLRINRTPSGRRRSLFGRRPGVTGGRRVTPRSVAAPPGPPGAARYR